MGKKISDEIISQIPILYKEFGTKKEVAEKLGISVATVTRYLTIYNATPAQGEQKKRTVITPEIKEEINRRYLECLNMSKVAKEMGISPSTVKRHLTEENLALVKNEYDDRDALFFYIYRLFGEQSEEQPISKWNIIQMQKFKEQGMPYRGQLLTLKYFFEIKKGNLKKSNGSIGIIPFIYDEARWYYEKQAKKAEEISLSIQKQLEKDRIEIKYRPSDYIGRKKRKKLIDLNTLEGD